MPRFAPAFFCALTCALVAFSAEPPTPGVERQLAVQSAIAAARKQLEANNPAAAVALLEQELANADGNKDYLNLLRQAYSAELVQQEKTAGTDPKRIAQTRRKLALLGGEAKEPESPPPPVVEAPAAGMAATPTVNASSGDAAAAFKQGNYSEAAKLFAAIGSEKLSPEHKTAWAYCRIKLAAECVNASTCDAAAAAGAAQDVAEALDLISDNAKLLASGREVLKAAQAKAKSAPASPAVVSGDAIETDSFRIVHGGNRELGDSIAKAAEAARKAIFERWSGPPAGAWHPKCEIVIHCTTDAYAKATGKPAALTGHATITLTNGRATARRLDLRADDESLISNTLPRELTHVVLADLFADKPPPKWALEGMAILAGSPEEISRYTRTLPRCERDGELRGLTALFELGDFPAEHITGFFCQSVSVTEYLIKLGGERNFKIFLGDAQRYGLAQALKRQYGIEGIQALEGSWKRSCLEQARGQTP